MGLVISLILMTVIGGLTPVGARMAVNEIPPMFAAWLRFGTAGILLYATMRARGQRLPFNRSHLPTLLGISLLCVPINQLGFLGGIKLTNASHAALFYALTPVLVFWGSVLARKSSYSGIMLVSAVLAFAGATCVLYPSLRVSFQSSSGWSDMFLGDLLLMLAVASWAAFVISSKAFLQKYGALASLTAVFLLGAAVHTPFGLWSLRSFDAPGVTWRGVSGFFFITVVSSYLGYLLTYIVIAKYDATRAMIVVNAQFLITVLVERVFFDVPLTIYFAGGSVLILSAIGLDVMRSWSAPLPVKAGVPIIAPESPPDSA